MKFRAAIQLTLTFIALSAVATSAQVPAGTDTAAVDSLTFTEVELSTSMTSGDVLASGMTSPEKISTLNAMVLADPRNPRIYNDLGVLYAELEQWVPARDAFISAIQADPRNPDYHRNLGLVNVQLAQYEMAVSEFRAYQRLAPDGGPDAYRMIGGALKEAGRPDEAAAVYREGLSLAAGMFEIEQVRLVVGLAVIMEESGDDAALDRLLGEYSGPAQDLINRAESSGDAATAGEARAITGRLVAKYVRDAKLMLDSDLPAEAAALYEKAFALDRSRGGDLLPRIGESWLGAGDTDKAKMAAGLATREYPEASGAWQAKGLIAENEGRLRDAVEAYVKAAELAPEATHLDARIGSIYMQLGENQLARRHMSSAINDPDTAPELLYNYSLSLIRDKKYALAVAPLRRVVDNRPDMLPAWKALAGSLRQTKDYAAAVRAYERALEMEPDARLAFQMGFCLGKLKRHTDAAAAYRKAIELDPAYDKAHYNLALSLIAAKSYEDALAVLEPYREMEPESYRVALNIGICLYNLGRYGEAVDAYDEALGLRETAAAWNNLGLAYDKLGDKEEALRCYKAAKKLK